MVVIQHGHGREARRQQQPGARGEQRGVVPPLRPLHQVTGGGRGTGRPRCRGGQSGGGQSGGGQSGDGRSDADQDGKGGQTAQDVTPAYRSASPAFRFGIGSFAFDDVHSRSSLTVSL
jgi:hypothetical protein